MRERERERERERSCRYTLGLMLVYGIYSASVELDFNKILKL